MSTLSYYIETNNDNVRVEYREINYVPNSVVWENGVNSFNNLEEVDPDIEGTPDYVRIGTSMFTYYMKYLVVPTRETKFTIHVLSNGSEDNVAVTYDVFSSFMQCTSIGSEITVLTKTNNKTSERTGTITIYSTYDSTDVLYINVYQEYIHIHLSLEDFIFESGGEITNGNIQNVEYEHLFNCLTNKNTPEKQELVIHVNVTGPRKKFFIKKITKFETIGELDNTYLYADGFYYRVKQKYVNGELVTYHDRVIVGSNGLVYDEFKYENDLDISVSSNKLTITNYGRCFLGEDAYYVLTLANADDFRNTCTVIIRYSDVVIDPVTPVPVTDNYLTFTALEPNSTIQIIKVGDPSDVELEYSLDGGDTWNPYTIEQVITLASINDRIKFKGNNNSFSHTIYKYYKFVMSGVISASGDVTSLVYENGGDVQLVQYAFCYLFHNCTSLTTPPLLPSTNALQYCYCGMFMGCTSLTTAPALPATRVWQSCYQYMFQGCTSLTQTPNLPATSLASNCYLSMFQDCTQLTTINEISANVMAVNSCRSMFQNCTSLVTPPSLPAMTLANQCYQYMFRGCTSLTTMPTLPATTLAEECYNSMFNGCTSLTTVKVLPSQTMVKRCYYGMFYGCTSLSNVPSNMLPSTTLAYCCYGAMFDNCSSLTTTPVLPAATLVEQCYIVMFENCTSLTTSPVLSALTLVGGCYAGMFRGCSNLNHITALFLTTPTAEYTQNWVNGVSSTGVFIKNCDATWDVRGTNGIPNNWDVFCVEPDNPLTFTANTAGSTIKLNKVGTLSDKNL